MKFIQIFLLFFSIIGLTTIADQNIILPDEAEIKNMTYEEFKGFFPKYEKHMRKKFEKTEEFLAHIRSWRAFSDKFFVVYVVASVCFIGWAIYNKKKNDEKIKQENAQKIG
jgi:hypothetical protein